MNPYNMYLASEEFHVVDTNKMVEEKIQQYLEKEKSRKEFTPLKPEVVNPEEYTDDMDALFQDQEDWGEEAEAGQEASPAAHDPQEDAEAIIAAAQIQAQQIIEDAQKQAQAMTEGIQLQADQLRMQAEKDGFEMGKANGLKEVAQEKEQYQALQEQLRQEYMIKEASMERDLVDTIIDVVDKVFHSQFSEKRNMILQMVADAINGIEGAKYFNIRVSPDNVEFLSSMRDDFGKKVGTGVTIEISADSALSDDQCMLETETGVFDCSPFKEFDNLCRDIRAIAAGDIQG